MDKIKQLAARKAQIAEVGKEIRGQIVSLCDENSFVELSAFSFSKNEFYGDDAEGEGVVCGFATIDASPYYLVAQNANVCQGGISKANCDKIAKCLDLAEKNTTPVVWILNSNGVQFGEGVTVLEGLAKLLMRATQLKGVVPQYAIINGDVIGSVAMLASVCDFTFFIEKKSVLALNSPLVFSAKVGKNLKKEEVGSLSALDKSGIPSVTVKSFDEIRGKISALSDLLGVAVTDLDEAELNLSFPALNKNADAKAILSIIEDGIEIGAQTEPDVKTLLGRIGGISAAILLFDGEKDGVKLTQDRFAKIKSFVELASCYSLPLVVFTNTLGVCPCLNQNNSRVMKEAAEYLNVLDTVDTAKISVVYGKAIGLGYSLFASKSVGFDYVCAFANAKIALFDDVQGAKIEFSDTKADLKTLEKRYADDNSDPINAAKDGYIDAIIEPQFVKQHLIALLQML